MRTIHRPNWHPVWHLPNLSLLWLVLLAVVVTITVVAAWPSAQPSSPTSNVVTPLLTGRENDVLSVEWLQERDAKALPATPRLTGRENDVLSVEWLQADRTTHEALYQRLFGPGFYAAPDGSTQPAFYP